MMYVCGARIRMLYWNDYKNGWQWRDLVLQNTSLEWKYLQHGMTVSGTRLECTPNCQHTNCKLDLSTPFTYYYACRKWKSVEYARVGVIWRGEGAISNFHALAAFEKYRIGSKKYFEYHTSSVRTTGTPYSITLARKRDEEEWMTAVLSLLQRACVENVTRSRPRPVPSPWRWPWTAKRQQVVYL